MAPDFLIAQQLLQLLANGLVNGRPQFRPRGSSKVEPLHQCGACGDKPASEDEVALACLLSEKLLV